MIRRAFCGLWLLLLAGVAFAGLSPPMALNYDLSVNSEFRAGNKPVAGAACPTGWTCAAKGDGTEDIDVERQPLARGCVADRAVDVKPMQPCAAMGAESRRGHR